MRSGKSIWSALRDFFPPKPFQKSDYDNADAQYKEAEAQADNIRAIIKKKTIRAPFAGRLGIRLINLGQILNEGQPIVSLQSIDPIYVNFLLPQQQLVRGQAGPYRAYEQPMHSPVR